jgi:glutamyl-tRNA synthetase
MSFDRLADLLFPDIDKTPAHYLNSYRKRTLPSGAFVTRYAPSPTGFQHIGGVFMALLNERLAKQSSGIFFLRIEDTDQKREVEGAIDDTIATMHKFGIDFDEGMTSQTGERGEHGPYRQSHRELIYKTFAKDLVRKGLAYPCFCTAEDLDAMREKQTTAQLNPGYWGQFARCRHLSAEEAMERVRAGHRWIVRFRSPGDPERRIEWNDLIKGHVALPENNRDEILVKGDGLPTYHFAHAIDDTLMGTTHVVRGEEWLSSLPTHLQLFAMLGFPPPNYAHCPLMLKQEGTSRRKLSKRKDPEAAATYYDEEGFPPQSVVEYLLNIINSSFEDWRKANPTPDNRDFRLSLEKMNKSGALFDLVKLSDVSKDVIGKMTADEVFERYVAWAKRFDAPMFDLVGRHGAMVRAIFAIDRGGPNPRKDFAKWKDVQGKISYFFEELFAAEEVAPIEGLDAAKREETKRVIRRYLESYTHTNSKDGWFEELKSIAVELGYTADRKEFKRAPSEYRGMVADVAGMVRLALTRRTNTPDLYSVMQILGEDRVKIRFRKFIEIP